MDPSTGTIDGTGRLVCRTCSAGAQSAAASQLLVDQDPTTARNLYGASAASAGLGIVSCCASGLGSWFFIVTLMPIASASTVLYLLATQSKARASLGNGVWIVAALATVGLLFGLMGSTVGLLAVTSMFQAP